MKSYIEACRIIKDEIQLLETGTEEVTLLNSLNRVISEDIFSDINLPSFDNSAMDGIVINFKEGISKWKIDSEISAGKFAQTYIGEDNAALIMTGAKIPEGGNTVIPVEDISVENDTAILKSGAKYKFGQNIRKAGQDLKKNELIAGKFITLKPRHISLLASCGIPKVRVLKKYNFGIITTGDELVDIGSKCSGDKIYASNLYTLIALIEELNMDHTNFGICNDNKNDLRDVIHTSLHSNIDFLITSGGVSVGKFDFVMEVLKELGAEIIFWKVNIKPGKPLLFAKINIKGKKKLIFGLPGNPVSSFVNFHLFIKNILTESYFHSSRRTITAELVNDLKKNDLKRHFIRGIVDQNGNSGKYFVKEIENQSSSNMMGLSVSNALITIEEDRINLKTGDEVECIMI
ncbi:MAG: molybdopterin molybdotransferase MoeA [Ignavibacteria bacterium]|nr:molybdopterin molybdotransferase MoeA [Ignavibacteria bacterium]